MRIVTRLGMVECTNDHSLFRPDGTIVTPNDLRVGDAILHGSDELLVQQIKQYMPPIDPRDVLEIGADVLMQRDLATVCLLARAIGCHAVVHPHGVRVSFQRTPPENGMIILSIESHTFPESRRPLVYDIETSSGRFVVGTRLVVHNTDSVMVNFPGATQAEANVYATTISETVSACFRYPMKLQHEETAQAMLMLTKKMYAFRVGDNVVVKGLKRRDPPRFIRETMSAIVDTILSTLDPDAAVRVFRDALHRLLHNTVPYADLTISKQLRTVTYAAATKPPHVVAADKMRRRDPDTAPKTGDHVAFLIVQGSGATIGEQAEDPEWAERNGLRPDLRYYTQLLESQTRRIFQVCGVAHQTTAMASHVAGQTMLPWAPPVTVASGAHRTQPVYTSPPRKQQTLPWAPPPPPLEPIRRAPSVHTSPPRRKQPKLTAFFGKVV
jgi:hypothetical protein